ncbi:MAG: hypothetical protein V1846_04735 [Candidatus Komeilibacteria bacterium]
MKFLLISAVLFLLLIIPWPWTGLQLLVTVLYLAGLSYLLGCKYSPTNELIFRLALGLLLVLSLIMVGSTIFFYLASLNYWTLLLTAALPPLALLWPYQAKIKKIIEPSNLKTLLLPLVQLFLGLGLLWVLQQHATTEPIQSPWQILPASIWPIYTATCLLSLIIATSRKTSAWIKILSASWQLFMSISLVLWVYSLGFGFDPFIHQATEKIIVATGTISPRPLYYIGYYGLVVWLHYWSQISLSLIDSWLLPCLTALLLPATIYFSFRCNFRSEPRALAVLPLFFLLLPYPFFIQSTPQGLSLLWSLLIILLSFFYIQRQQLPAVIILLLAIGALTLHPLSGIPMIFYTAMLIVYHRSWEASKLLRWLRLTVYGLLAALAALALPLVFTLQSQLTPLNTNSLSSDGTGGVSLWQLPAYYRFIRWDDLLYLFSANSKLLFILLALLGFWYVIKRHRAHYFINYLITYLVVIVNYLLLSWFIPFDWLLPYERQSYPERILTLSYFFLWPLAFITFYWLTKKILRSPRLMQMIIGFFLALTMTISWYLSYPRWDYYAQNKGFNTSRHDLAAVTWIQARAGQESYVVLANQAVSAAAIQTLGFQPYYRGHYLYPIPTGDPLYQSYLDAVYNRQPLTSVCQDVQALTGVSQVYLVVNDYWSDFPATIERLKKTATLAAVIDGGRSYIFILPAG